ncbi:MAG: YceI family protein [Crocinitomicaceae bacterium]|nr:YceI family protein [Crocinitomicaceae bacterium]
MIRTQLLLISLLVASVVNSQYRLDDKLSFMYVDGTSNLHDWTITVNQMTGSLKANIANKQLKSIVKASISIPVKSLKSEKSAMDENMYKALKLSDHSTISYELTKVEIVDSIIHSVGKLTIAGVTKEMKTKSTFRIVGEHIKFYGKMSLNMTDYNISPPEFLFGAFKTGNKVAIRYYFMFCNGLESKH